jgi:hypothetical protein
MRSIVHFKLSQRPSLRWGLVVFRTPNQIRGALDDGLRLPPKVRFRLARVQGFCPLKAQSLAFASFDQSYYFTSVRLDG